MLRTDFSANTTVESHSAAKIDLNLLKILVAVHEAGSVSKAASNLQMPQSKVSRALGKLRVDINDPLFVRTSQGVIPTPMATRLAEAARLALNCFEYAFTSVSRFDPASAADELRVLCGDIMETAVLTQLLPPLAVQSPRSKICFVTKRSADIQTALERGELDLAVGNFPELKCGSICSVKIGVVSFASYARVDHPLSGCPLTIDQYCQAQHILMEAESCCISDLAERWLNTNRVHRNIAVRTRHFHCMPSIMQSSDLIATAPTDAYGTWYFGGEAIRLILPFKFPMFDVKVYWHTRVQSDPRHRWWRRMLIEELRRAPQRSAEMRRAAGRSSASAVSPSSGH